ncbi:hypothetical protein BN2476_620054 [Paraburkholderia piptadeniae]|uniref:Uncharacterized protein n=1 Tax=Paraburkholderia piptadeniae TaxID=1701573 RepID=A0A1N7SL18_9BURK|nr:hypothetical protein BN2476_620054 [Paraburkholderia piptadeniae]
MTHCAWFRASLQAVDSFGPPSRADRHPDLLFCIRACALRTSSRLTLGAILTIKEPDYVRDFWRIGQRGTHGGNGIAARRPRRARRCAKPCPARGAGAPRL